jgi:hypothetical protein
VRRLNQLDRIDRRIGRIRDRSEESDVEGGLIVILERELIGSNGSRHKSG